MPGSKREQDVATEEKVRVRIKEYDHYKRLRVLYRQLRARRALSLFNNVPLTARWALSPLTLYSESTLLVLKGTLLISGNALLALN